MPITYIPVEIPTSVTGGNAPGNMLQSVSTFDGNANYCDVPYIILFNRKSNCYIF